jgi:hypothetical protein
LESAFLEKQAGTWKVIFMHSTRVPRTSQNPVLANFRVADHPEVAHSIQRHK